MNVKKMSKQAKINDNKHFTFRGEFGPRGEPGLIGPMGKRGDTGVQVNVLSAVFAF